MRVVEVGQYFVTKNIGSFKQFRSVACPNTLCLEMIQLHRQKDGFKEMRIGPVLDVRPVLSTSNMELKFEFGP